MDAPKLKVVESIYESNYRDVVATLRVIADEIESGKHGKVGEVALVLLGDELSVFGMGPDSDRTTVHYLLCGGAARMVQALLDHGKK
jgi:hypothetical protein